MSAVNDIFGEILNSPIVQTIGTAILLAVVALWLMAAWWAYQDASRRSESSVAGFAAAGWIILSTPLLLPLSMVIYTMARPHATASDDRTVRLMAQLNQVAADRPTCPGCKAVVDADWLRCPWCASWFEIDCDACGEWSAVGLEICPFCGEDRAAVPAGWVAVEAFGDGKAAAGKPAAADRSAGAPRLQRGRMASSWRPASYEASRASSSVSS
jgi:hypothetical protein